MRNITLILLPVAIVIALAVSLLSNIGHKDFNVPEWGLFVLALLVIGWLAALMLNFAIFVPVYWLLGRSKCKQTDKETKHKGIA